MEQRAPNTRDLQVELINELLVKLQRYKRHYIFKQNSDNLSRDLRVIWGHLNTGLLRSSDFVAIIKHLFYIYHKIFGVYQVNSLYFKERVYQISNESIWTLRCRMDEAISIINRYLLGNHFTGGNKELEFSEIVAVLTLLSERENMRFWQDVRDQEKSFYNRERDEHD